MAPRDKKISPPTMAIVFNTKPEEPSFSSTLQGYGEGNFSKAKKKADAAAQRNYKVDFVFFVKQYSLAVSAAKEVKVMKKKQKVVDKVIKTSCVAKECLIQMK
uniref:Uncharacterized protein n=1 Tax=Odontella aurita TaxID=265563 RepID=A0A7S4HNJ4_9STRA|mmetsp:Transcript_12789/g.37603  ORF Transcript_12789/g.37603 Transcript_12789/m.37603 type:complete len:103 (+) Transcript_12789:138-446(+)|eukprot:CAMPEP_0113560322 /NCGR_PEP_ID=MMETSP0015_2-20120614/19369_1 /TAXON_ID=2838 /ORGANISM="Odontella" /LENGTH=102 /DNA_ID=CAMNT_0000462019 /DNA_START=132 /DNA_END=440 /DNA_ORIENTATION=+ /assembly_acc=CAM_ASM_000160